MGGENDGIGEAEELLIVRLRDFEIWLYCERLRKFEAAAISGFIANVRMLK